MSATVEPEDGSDLFCLSSEDPECSMKLRTKYEQLTRSQPECRERASCAFECTCGENGALATTVAVRGLAHEALRVARHGYGSADCTGICC